MKKLFTLIAFLAVFMGAKAEWVEDYKIDYSTKTSFPFYVMGYVPEWVDGIMTDYGADYRYATQADLDGDGDAKWKDGESSVGSVMAGTTEYQKVTGAGPYWHQYIIAADVPMELDETYTIKALIKSSAAVNDINLQFGNWGSLKETSVSIPASSDFQEVEWEVSGCLYAGNGFICIQPASSTAVIEWKSLTVSHNKKAERPTTWQEWLTSDGKPVVVTGELKDIPNWMGNASTAWPSWATEGEPNETWKGDKTGLICAWGKAKGSNEGPNFKGDGTGFNPFPATIEADPKDPNNKVFVVHGAVADTEGDPSAWDNQFWIQSPKAWKSGDQVKIHFRYMASQDVSSTDTQIHYQNPSEYLIWHAIGNIAFTTEWQDFDGIMTIQDDMAGGWSIAFNLNTVVKDAVDFYFDDLSWQSMVLDEGLYIAAANPDTGLEYDFDNAIEFDYDEGEDLFTATVGTVGKQDTWVSEIMISTIRGNDAAFKSNTLKPAYIENNPDKWPTYTASSLAKLKLPAVGVWTVSVDTLNKQMNFVLLEGEENDPIDVVTNTTEIVVKGAEREDLIDEWNAQSSTLNVREEADNNPDDEHGLGGAGHTGQTWDNQFFIVANRTLVKGEVTHLYFKYKASKEAKTTTQCHVAPGAYKHWGAIGDVTFTTEWQEFDADFTVPNEADGMQSIAFNMAEIKEACDYEITDVQWYLKDETLAEGKTWENLINKEGDSNFYVKEGAGTNPYIPSGIINVINDAATRSNVIYNLSGQRVSKDYKGIVIINGRKVVNK